MGERRVRIPGVTYNTRERKWIGFIRIEGKKIFTDYYDSDQDAAIAREYLLLEHADEETRERLLRTDGRSFLSDTEKDEIEDRIRRAHERRAMTLKEELDDEDFDAAFARPGRRS